jgi:hypothetical protein
MLYWAVFGLGGPNVHMPVDCHRIHADDFSAYLLRQEAGKLRFSAGGGTAEG